MNYYRKSKQTKTHTHMDLCRRLTKYKYHIYIPSIYTEFLNPILIYYIYIHTLKVFCNMIQSTTKWKHFLMKNNKKYTNKISTSLKFNNIFLNNKSICSHKNNSNRLFKICNKTRYFSAASAAVDVK